MLPRKPPRSARLAARARGVGITSGYLGILAAIVGRVSGLLSPGATLVVLFAAWLVLAVGLPLSAGSGAPSVAPRPVAPPFRGRWRAVNSPANRIPSHGTHAFGQTFATDFTCAPDGGASRDRLKNDSHPPEDFPGFGQEILAPADGRVLLVRDRWRDHRSRSGASEARSWLEGQLRQLGGSRPLFGNLIVLDLGDGVFAALAHLKLRSAAVRRGEQVRRGQVLARCGNSGNSTEPHLHFQLMDRRSLVLAAGLPFTFIRAKDDPSPRVPRDGETVTG